MIDNENKENTSNEEETKETVERKEKIEVVVKQNDQDGFDIINLDESQFKSEEEKEKFKEELQKTFKSLNKIVKPSKKDKIIEDILLTTLDFIVNIGVFSILSFLIPWFDQKYSFSLDKLITVLVVISVYCLLMKLVMTIIKMYFLEIWSKLNPLFRVPLEAIVLCLSFMITKVNVENLLLLLITFIIFTFVATLLKLTVRKIYIMRKLRIFK